MQGEAPGRVMTGEPLILGTLGRDAAFGLPGLTAPGMPGEVDPDPVVPDGAAGGATWVGAVPVPVGEPPTWA